MLWQKRLPQNTKDAFVSGKRRSVLWPTGPLRWFLEPFLPLKAIDWVYHKYIKKSRLGSNKIQKAFKKNLRQQKRNLLVWATIFIFQTFFWQEFWLAQFHSKLLSYLFCLEMQGFEVLPGKNNEMIDET